MISNEPSASALTPMEERELALRFETLVDQVRTQTAVWADPRLSQTLRNVLFEVTRFGVKILFNGWAVTLRSDGAWTFTEMRDDTTLRAVLGIGKKGENGK